MKYIFFFISQIFMHLQIVIIILLMFKKKKINLCIIEKNVSFNHNNHINHINFFIKDKFYLKKRLLENKHFLIKYFFRVNYRITRDKIKFSVIRRRVGEKSSPPPIFRQMKCYKLNENIHVKFMNTN